MRDAGERVYDERSRCWVRLCKVFFGPCECHRCGLLTVSPICDFCRVELGIIPPRVAHDALIA